MSELNQTALKIVSNDKGILAADESNPSMIKKFDSINVKSNPENRLKYREILFSADGMKNHIGGVILFDETIKQITSSGTSIPDLIQNSGTIIGIKVDMGLKDHPDSSEEKVTEGLEGLKERLEEYYKMGARFTKWRALLNISEKYPSEIAIQSNANTLAKYAALVQESNMVPIVEPEVLMNGDHDINKCYQVTAKVLTACYAELKLHNVDLKGTLLKPNMVLPGTLSQNRNSTEEIAKMTLKCLKENVPSEVPGIAFLSGGQSEIEATRNLNEINKINDTNFVFTFSYGRALQQSALKYWGKNQEDIANTQNIFNHRAKMNSLSTSGRWTEDLDKSKSYILKAINLFEKNKDLETYISEGDYTPLEANWSYLVNLEKMDADVSIVSNQSEKVSLYIDDINDNEAITALFDIQREDLILPKGSVNSFEGLQNFG